METGRREDERLEEEADWRGREECRCTVFVGEFLAFGALLAVLALEQGLAVRVEVEFGDHHLRTGREQGEEADAHGRAQAKSVAVVTRGLLRCRSAGRR